MSGEAVPGSLKRLSFFPHPAWQIQLGTDQLLGTTGIPETGTEAGHSVLGRGGLELGQPLANLAQT